jgi:acyl-lipid omega-6 desaturase (Delta-12 desaturase)
VEAETAMSETSAIQTLEPQSSPHGVVAKPREGQALLNATRAFVKEDRTRSWTLLIVSLLVCGGFISIAAKAPWIPLRLAAGTFAGLTAVRLFIFFHDFMHLAIFRKSLAAKVILYVFGTLVLTPPNSWRDSHNYHHANTAKIVGSHVGSYAMVTTAMWEKMSAKERFMYKAIRHPLTILCGYFTIFMLGMCASPFLRAPKKNWDSAVALVVNWSLSALLIWKFGFAMFFFAMFVPLFVATATGAYLFYAQHNFPEIKVQPRHAWSFTKAALESSSYMKMSGIMHWFTGNIGYHHVHHLNPMIPFYLLPDAMAAIPELQEPPTTALSLKEVITCLKLKVWDAEANKMVPYS